MIWLNIVLCLISAWSAFCCLRWVTRAERAEEMCAIDRAEAERALADSLRLQKDHKAFRDDYMAAAESLKRDAEECLEKCRELLATVNANLPDCRAVSIPFSPIGDDITASVKPCVTSGFGQL